MLEGSSLTAIQVGGITAGAIVVDIFVSVAMKRFFNRAERGDGFESGDVSAWGSSR